MYIISVLESDAIIKAVTSGKVTLDDLNKTRLKIADICQTKRINRVLIDDRAVTSIPSFEDIFQFASSFFESGIPPFIRIAHVINGKKLSDNEFLETVAVNRGTNVKTFKDIDKAVDWLKS